eukprot:5138500-Alexandrium_andersonii.AAC.1
MPRSETNHLAIQGRKYSRARLLSGWTVVRRCSGIGSGGLLAGWSTPRAKNCSLPSRQAASGGGPTRR